MPAHHLYTENDCWKCLKDDDPGALGYLYDNYVDRLFISAMMVTADRELAKDALQEVFIEIWNYRKSIGEIRNTQAYLVKVLRRIVFRKQKLQLQISLGDEFLQPASSEQNAEEAIVAADAATEQQQRLKRAIAQLSKRQREILHLRFENGLNYDQIAHKMGMNYQSVNNLAFRTFRRLRGALTQVLVLFSLTA